MRIVLKKAHADGTPAVDMDPLSLLCRRTTSVPPPRLHTIKYAGVLAAASAWRRHLAAVGAATEVPQRSPGRGPPYWKSRGSFDAGGLSVGAGLRVYF